MKHNNEIANLERKRLPTFKKSLIALAVMSFASQGIAQEAESDIPVDESDVEVIKVSGVRGSVIKAQELRREGDTFVDAIAASDIGALPDRSVLEAMQRIPGISIERFAAANDPDHFGVEGSGAVVRGMSATRSEFNGRDSFTANSGRGLSFQDVPPELMGSVRVYKNQSADLIEGGIGGTVSLHTRLPFDSDERVIALSADATYSDLSESTTPTVSGMFSDSWNTDSGKFGFLINLADSELESRSDSLQSEFFLDRDDLTDDGSIVLAPNGGNFGTNTITRERTGVALAAQWESPDRKTLVTGQFMRSDATLSWRENTVSYQTDQNSGDEPDGFRRDSFPLEGTSYDFDDNGNFVNGVITDMRSSGGWRSNDRDRVPTNASWGDPNVPQFGNTYQTTTRAKEQRNIVDDYALNFKFRPSDSWSHEIDLQYINAETTDDDFTLYLGTQAIVSLDLRDDLPKIGLTEPWNGNPGGAGREGNEAFFQTPSSYYWRSAMDHIERSEGDSQAIRYDTKYTFDAGFFTSVKAGVRYAKREQLVRNSAYNWDNTGALFGGDKDPDDGLEAAWLDSTSPGVVSLANDIELVSWDDHSRGGHVSVPGGSTIHPSYGLVKDYMNLGSRLAGISKAWVPLAERQIQIGIDANGNPTFEQLDGPFRPAEINDFNESNKAAYVRFDFEYDEMDYPITGNIGLRYVEVERSTRGAVTFDDLVPRDGVPDGSGLPAQLTQAAVNGYITQQVADGLFPDEVTARKDPSNDFIGESKNYLSADERAFGDYGTSPLDSTYSENFLLPSLNIKAEVADDMIVRFAVSKALAYPDTGSLKNFVRLGSNSVTVRNVIVGEEAAEDPVTSIESSSIVSWTGRSGNPQLAPMEAIQYDLAFEWYMSEDSSITATLFYKDLKNFFATGAKVESFTNNGVTNQVIVTKPINTEKGTMQGLELGYSQFFDSLPEPFDGLGLQANYTYIEASGVPNNDIANGSITGVPDTGGSTGIAFDKLPLEGQSKHTANLIVMYEKDDISARIAYNWRSAYLLTARDVIRPNRPVYNESGGYLDASVFYDINDNIKIGLQGTNLSNTVSKTTMQNDVEGNRAPRSWFTADRRLSFVVRATF